MSNTVTIPLDKYQQMEHKIKQLQEQLRELIKSNKVVVYDLPIYSYVGSPQTRYAFLSYSPLLDIENYSLHDLSEYEGKLQDNVLNAMKLLGKEHARLVRLAKKHECHVRKSVYKTMCNLTFTERLKYLLFKQLPSSVVYK